VNNTYSRATEGAPRLKLEPAEERCLDHLQVAGHRELVAVLVPTAKLVVRQSQVLQMTQVATLVANVASRVAKPTAVHCNP